MAKKNWTVWKFGGLASHRQIKAHYNNNNAGVLSFIIIHRLHLQLSSFSVPSHFR
jgi:hypothetical protein